MSEFRFAMDEEFGAAHARVIEHDLVIGALGDRTPVEALAAGTSALRVWLAVCEAQGVPTARRHGRGRPEPRR
ncbi:MAG: DUF3046 domain-containing protein [Microbacteriaceae bacterium]